MDPSSRRKLQSTLLADATFAALSTNAERVSYVLEQVMSFFDIRLQMKANLLKARQRTDKSATKANCYTEGAKLHLAAGDLTEALAALRQALLYTPSEEHQLKKRDLFISMARVHLDRFNHAAALWAVDQAIELQWRSEQTSETIIDQVLLRAKCLHMLGRTNEAIESIHALIKTVGFAFGLSKEEQRQIIALLETIKRDDVEYTYSSDLQQWHRHQQEMTLQAVGGNVRGITGTYYHLDPVRIAIRNSAQFGRHFVATTPIPAETTILEERPISVVLQPDAIGIKCCACHHELDYRCYPCEWCTAAIYCDLNCAQQDWADTHHGTCHGLRDIMLQIGSFPLHLFQMITRVGGSRAAMAIQASAVGYSIEQYLEERSNHQESEERAISDYKMATILACHEGKQSPEETVNQVVIAIETAMALVLVEQGTEEHTDTDFFVQLAAMLVTDLHRIIYNVFGWTNWKTNLHVANCQALVGSLVNHSCVSNVRWEWSEGVISFKTKREIEAGEEITISYGPQASESYYNRQRRLNHYYFACSCKACLASASSGNSLKCRSCATGPVVFDSALNQNPQLHGKCLLCLAPYEKLDRAISKLNRTKEVTKTTAELSLFLPFTPESDQVILLEALNSLSIIHKLALADSKPVLEATLAVVAILERCSSSLEQLSLDERLIVFTLLDLCLPSKLPSKLLNGQVLRSLAFCFKTAIKWNEELCLASNACTFNSSDALSLVIQFHRRYQQALASIQKVAQEDGLLEQVVSQIMEQLDQKLV